MLKHYLKLSIILSHSCSGYLECVGRDLMGGKCFFSAMLFSDKWSIEANCPLTKILIHVFLLQKLTIPSKREKNSTFAPKALLHVCEQLRSC